MRGSSGAVIEVKSTYVRKWAPANTIGPRILEQGRFLQELQGDGIVRVRKLLDTGAQLGYEMEHLTVPPIDLLDMRIVLKRILVSLSDHVWCDFNDPVQYDAVAHRNRMDPLWEYGGHHSIILQQALERIEHLFVSDLVVACRTHGDPIMDNVLLRGERVVLTDPIRATPAIPDLRCVDIGRMIQSAVGYERIRYGLRGPISEGHDFVRELVGGFSGTTWHEWLCSMYWACCHLLRSMHYVDAETRNNLKRYCLPALVGDLSKQTEEL